ncbi:MAG: hypothetical protein KA236_07255 [Verrucomicrobia bacterium]|nr:hypothetical protein [Verrucomicrobiota bacterium]
MKLHAPIFERRLRRRIKQTIRRSPELRRQARRQARYRNRAWHYGVYSIQRLLLSGAGAVITVAIARNTGQLTAALAFVGLWLFALVFFQAQSLAEQLYASPDLPALGLLPIEMRTIFRRQFEKFLWRSTWLLVDLVMMLGALMLWTELPWLKGWVVIPSMLLAWGAVLALTGLALRYCPRLPFGQIFWLTFLLGFVLLLTRSFFGPQLLALWDRNAETLILLLPPAWPLALIRLAFPKGSPSDFLFLLPAVGLIGTLRHTVRQLAANYEFSEPLEPEAEDVLPETSASETVPMSNAPARAGVTTIQEHVATHAFLAPANWIARGGIEAWFWRWLTDGERKLAEFAFPGKVQLTRQWKRIFRDLLLGGVLAMTFGRINFTFRTWIWAGTILFTILRVGGLFYANGHAFTPIFCSGVNLQLHTVYPVGYRELSRVLFKFTLVQFPCLLIYALIAGGAIAHLAGLEILAGAVMGGKAAVLLAALRGPAIAMAFSAGTNDSTLLGLRPLLVAVFVLTGLVLIGLSIACVWLTAPLLSAGLGLGAILLAWWFWWLYGWFYNTNKFDVMNLPRETI